ncbi:hypothetical protein HA466_0082890 [Hirschfeldia incana]|nr:hypothetical protein HA466_0082890 [Hirschfeldia incana]
MAIKMLTATKLTQTNMIKQILKRCSSLGKKQSSGYNVEHEQDGESFPLDVPKGHFVVYVGENRARLRKSLASITTWASPFLVRK